MKQKKLFMRVDRTELTTLRLKMMGLGGLSKAAAGMKINYWRLSRILNGWILPTEEELQTFQGYIEAGFSEPTRRQS